MTEKEAIKHLRAYRNAEDRTFEYFMEFEPKAKISDRLGEIEMYNLAIQALEEIQQYREIGTVDEVKEAIAFYKNTKESSMREIVEKCAEYEKIGTINECRAAVEKQKAKKPKDEVHAEPELDENGAYVDADVRVNLFCPICGELVGIDDMCDKFCRECGQALDGGEEE